MDLLTGTVQRYPWGDRRALAELQGRPPTDEPEAELWFGAHPVAPSRLADERSLLDAVEEAPEDLLGPAVSRRFGRFPYLLKILAAAEPLSIQAHPSLAAAKAGHAREEACGIPIDAPSRTYRDDNHKPELICALTPFEAKCGFRDPAATIAAIEELRRAASDRRPVCSGSSISTLDDGDRLSAELCRRLQRGGAVADAILDTVDWLLHLRPAAVRSIVELLVTAAGSPPVHGDEVSWLPEMQRHHPDDRGIVVSQLLNHVSLAPGEAMFLPAGNLHAYLRGVGVELMANSDNVVRGGLTGKHVDVDELLAIVDPNPGPAPIERPPAGDHRYRAPVDEFSLTRIEGGGPGAARRFEPDGPEIVLVTRGEARLQPLAVVGGGAGVRVRAGEAAFVAPVDGPYDVAIEGSSTAWRAAVGGNPDHR